MTSKEDDTIRPPKDSDSKIRRKKTSYAVLMGPFSFTKENTHGEILHFHRLLNNCWTIMKFGKQRSMVLLPRPFSSIVALTIMSKVLWTFLFQHSVTLLTRKFVTELPRSSRPVSIAPLILPRPRATIS